MNSPTKHPPLFVELFKDAPSTVDGSASMPVDLTRAKRLLTLRSIRSGNGGGIFHVR
jgi:hypothetical protein